MVMGANDLTTYLVDRVGQDLRGVLQYDGDDTKTLHLRDDLRQSEMQSRIDRMLRRLKPESMRAEEAAFSFGDLHVTVRCFDEAIILHFPTEQEQGIVVSLEPAIATDLTSFARTCSQEIAR